MRKFHKSPIALAVTSVLVFPFVMLPGITLAQGLNSEVSESIDIVEGVPGGTVTRSVTIDAEVMAIDYDSRSVTLADGDGNQRTLQIGPEAVNFDQVKVGDNVAIGFVEELVVYLEGESAEVDDGAEAMVATAPKGSKPQGAAVGAVQVTAVVTDVDLEAHTATLKFPDESTEVLPVRPDVALSEDRIGEKVVLRTTNAVGVSVTPAE